MTNSVDLDQTAPIVVCPGSTLFASILKFVSMLGNYLQQTTSADVIFQMHFFLGALRVRIVLYRGNTKPDLSDLVPFHSGQARNFYLLNCPGTS